MEQIPKIVMQCPKCLRRFSFGETYCESCSAMLEPIEADEEAKEPPAGDRQNRGEAPPVTNEKIEDIRIEALRADIETKFVNALLLEIRQLRKRLEKKEEALSSLREKEGGADHAVIASSAGKVESDIAEIMKKTTRLEMTLDNLAQKLASDIEALSAEMEERERPGIGGFFSEKGRYFRILSSELGTKKLLLGVIGGKRPASVLRIRNLTRPAVLGPSAAVVAILLALSLYTYSHNTARKPQQARRPVEQTGGQYNSRIGRKEVGALLEDIRQANLRKDLELWKSRYSAGYLSSQGREDDIAGLWKKIDFRSLQYRIDKFESGPEGARATITWYMQFRTRRGRGIKMIARRLRADFLREDGRLKISSVVKEKQ
jgi:hypothetical protein